MRIFPIVASLVIATCTLTPTADAGDRELGVVFVNMTPDAQSGGASKACVTSIFRKLKSDYTLIKKLGETRMRAMVKVPKSGDHFFDWNIKRIESVKDDVDVQFSVDTVLLVDCRPDEGVLDILVVPVTATKHRHRLRKFPQSSAIVKAITRRALSAAWIGFSP